MKVIMLFVWYAVILVWFGYRVRVLVCLTMFVGVCVWFMFGYCLVNSFMCRWGY